ncbi:hypothetical protein F3Y22_tig00111239pilonHSYRG00035 [Hibiscus syriacus]|uniref:WAT1-related protein n=1 Tax=Hibiscus syriacus TaxID=106335 RepID=A0A6A2YSH0_HIBSY|nr:hypothetical protein F3Y22_tig00111239pilonHSYRG00035 [Hibiscus syriacus]
MARRNGFKELVLPTIAMAAAQCSTVVVNILVKAASLKGMNYFVFVAYCYILGTLVFLLLASIFNRKTVLPPLKFPLFCRMFLLGVLGFSSQLLGCKGLELGSATLSSSHIMKMYPEEIAVNFFYYLLGTIICLPICLLVEPNLSSWRLSSSLAAVAVLYSGPVVVASFKPTQAIAVVMSFIFLGEAVFLGSVIGS